MCVCVRERERERASEREREGEREHVDRTWVCVLRELHLRRLLLPDKQRVACGSVELTCLYVVTETKMIVPRG